MSDSCNACGTTEYVARRYLSGDLPICGACYMIWYDSGITDPDALGQERDRREAAGEFPFKELADER